MMSSWVQNYTVEGRFVGYWLLGDSGNWALSSSKKEILSQEIQKLVDKGVLEKTKPSQDQFVSNVFLVPKPNNKNRLILDLSKCNSFVNWKHFKMFNLDTVLHLTSKGFFMASINLSDAYYSMPIHHFSRKSLRLHWKDSLYQYTCLPNGISSVPRDFTKFLHPVEKDPNKFKIMIRHLLEQDLLHIPDTASA